MKIYKMLAFTAFFAFGTFLTLTAGCGPGDVVMPEGELTDAQKAAIAAEDSSIEDEESGGMYKDGKKVKK